MLHVFVLLHGYLSYVSQRLFSSCKATCHALYVNACCDVYELQSKLSSDDETPLCNECDDEYGQWNGKVPWTNGAVNFPIGFLCRICYNVWMLGKFSAKYGNLQAYKDKIDSEKRGGESAVTHYEFMESRRNSLICACVHHLLPKPILVCVCICAFVSVCAMLSIYPSGRTSSRQKQQAACASGCTSACQRPNRGGCKHERNQHASKKASKGRQAGRARPARQGRAKQRSTTRTNSQAHAQQHKYITGSEEGREQAHRKAIGVRESGFYASIQVRPLCQGHPARDVLFCMC